MDLGLPDSSGTDDDLPHSHLNDFLGGGHGFVKRRSMVVGVLPQMHVDMEAQIHHVEQEAYTSVLRAFKAQSDAITWEKESLITELRKELRVSDEEHRELLSRVNAGDIIKRIREWRKASGLQPGMCSGSLPTQDNQMPSSSVSASFKKQKTSQSVASMSLGVPPLAWHPSIQQSSVRGEAGPFPRSKGQTAEIRSTGRSQVASRGSSGSLAVNGPSGALKLDQLIGRKVWTRWPRDNNFYEAVIIDYNPVEGRHALVYDINTSNEAWEWVNIKEDQRGPSTAYAIPPPAPPLVEQERREAFISNAEAGYQKADLLVLISQKDIQWEGNDIGPILGTRPSGPGHGIKKSMPRGAALARAGRGHGLTKGESMTNHPSSRNVTGKLTLGDIEILHTDTLIKEVEKVISANHPDPVEIEKAKKVLKDHELALLHALTRLDDASDGESGRRELRQFLHGQPTDKKLAWRWGRQAWNVEELNAEMGKKNE